MTLRDRVEKWTVATLVGGLFAVTFGLAVVGEELPARFTAPAILMALLLIIFLISPVEQIHKDVRFLREPRSACVLRRTTPCANFTAPSM